MTRSVLAASLGLALLAGAVGPVAAAPYVIARWTVDGGGTSHVGAGTFVLGGTAGQPDPGRLVDRTYAVLGGFWGPGGFSSVDVPVIPPDSGPALSDAIDPAMPNPFAASTRVSFALAKPGRVEARVFDVRGALVRTLESGELPAGRHVRTWDGRDEAGAPLRPGVYLLRVRIPSRGDVQKLVILR